MKTQQSVLTLDGQLSRMCNSESRTKHEDKDNNHGDGDELEGNRPGLSFLFFVPRVAVLRQTKSLESFR